jgi:hypothetical protein
MGPDLLARGSVQRDDRIIVRQNVDHAMRFERVEQIVIGVARGKCPRNLQIARVRSVDLSKRRVLPGIGRSPIIAPTQMRVGVSPLSTGKRGQKANAQRKKYSRSAPPAAIMIDHFPLPCRLLRFDRRR